MNGPGQQDLPEAAPRDLEGTGPTSDAGQVTGGPRPDAGHEVRAWDGSGVDERDADGEGQFAAAAAPPLEAASPLDRAPDQAASPDPRDGEPPEAAVEPGAGTMSGTPSAMSLTALVVGGFASVLGREPGELSLAHYLTWLAERIGESGPETAAEKFTDSLLYSEEGQARLKLLFPPPPPPPLPPPAPLPDSLLAAAYGQASRFDEISSLGTHGYAAALLQRAGLRRESGPFDWILSSSQMVRHVLRDDFRLFLDRSLMVPVPPHARPDPAVPCCDHTFYRDHYGVSPVFQGVDAVNDRRHALLTRRVAGFRAKLRGRGRRLFVQVAADHPKLDAEFERSVACLTEVASPGAVLLVIGVAEGLAPSPVPEFEAVATDGAHRCWRMAPVDGWGQAGFADPIDDLAVLRAVREMVPATVPPRVPG